MFQARALPNDPVSKCLVNHAAFIASRAKRIRALHEAVGDVNSLKLHQWVHFHALALEYQPDLVIEFGRGFGNSTVAFAEAFQSYTTADGGRGRIFSMCISDCWEVTTEPRLRTLPDMPQTWFDPINARRIDILKVDFAPVVADAKRVLVLWDAHGTEIADVILSRLLPLIADREHFIAMHDISDVRYCGNPPSYQGKPFWRGQESGWSSDTARLNIGWIDTVVEQTIPALDFLSRNGLELQSADHRVKCDIVDVPETLNRLNDIYPDDLFNTVNHWAYFSLNGTEPPYHFPTYGNPKSNT